jgi:hypothetical protein
MAYPIGLNGVVVGEGDTYDAALSDVRSVIKFHIEPAIEAFVAEAGVSLARPGERPA